MSTKRQSQWQYMETHLMRLQLPSLVFHQYLQSLQLAEIFGWHTENLGKENAEGGLWEMCKGTGELKECTPYTEIPGNKNI